MVNKSKDYSILNAADYLFAQKGFAVICMRDIAYKKEVNIDLTCYYYCKSKELLKNCLMLVPEWVELTLDSNTM
jgi:DNA-binding transcriptional regulator YbjK